MPVPYTPEQIELIAEMGRDPKNWQLADQEAWELGKRMADAIADTYTDDDWHQLLNRLSPSRAAKQIASRPREDRRRLLGLIEPERRANVELLLPVTA